MLTGCLTKTGFYYRGAPSAHSARPCGGGWAWFQTPTSLFLTRMNSVGGTERDGATHCTHEQQGGIIAITTLFSRVVWVTGFNMSVQVDPGWTQKTKKTNPSAHYCNQNDIALHTAGCGNHRLQWQWHPLLCKFEMQHSLMLIWS